MARIRKVVARAAIGAQPHPGEDLPDRRVVGDRPAEGARWAAKCVRLHEGPPHQPAGGEGVVHARGVEDDADQVAEAVVDRTDRLAERTVELDLAGGHRAGAELAS